MGESSAHLIYKEVFAMRTLQLKGMLLTFAIVGNTMAGSGNAAEESGLGTVVPEAEMTQFCQNAAAARFEVQLDAITTNPPITRDGRQLVLGTVDGEDHDYGFDCRFDGTGAYLGTIGDPAMND
jgi:hypothetical protein